MSVRKGIRFQRFSMLMLRIFIGKIFATIIGFKYKVQKPKAKTYLILSNHNSDLDPVRVILGTGKHARFVSSANVLKGFLGFLLKLFFAPIPRNKGASADETVALILENLKNGISVAMFPEGNKSWDGETGYISPRTAKLVKESGAALITYRLDGGYMRSPRWAKYERKGPVFGSMVAEYSAEELEKMTEEEVYEIILRDLHVNAYEEQRKSNIKYKCKNRAEGMELSGYICPTCKRFDTVRTKGNFVFCECGMKGELDDKGFLHSENMPFDNLFSWCRWERDYVSENKDSFDDKAISKDSGLLFKRNGVVEAENVTATIYKDKIRISADKDYDYPMNAIKNISTFRTTRMFFTCADEYVELFRKEGISGIKYFTLWRIFTGKVIK